jgi:uncharacterized protein (DUF1800 family)
MMRFATPALAVAIAWLCPAAPALAEGADPLRVRMLGVGATPDRAEDQRDRDPQARPADAGPPLTQRQMIDHVISRLTFGPTPGLAEQVAAEGWEAWARRQLQPHTIDESEYESRLARRYPSLTMSMTDIFHTYRPPYENNPPTLEERRQRNRLRAKCRRELRESVLDRAVHSKAQFREVIVEFWRNHLNVDQQKDDVGYLANHYEQHVIRAHAFGRYEDMLLASARHPAMLIYLDNIVSQKPLGKYDQKLLERYEGRDRKPRSVEALQRYSGLNENYARELMELHTLGVDNGYTQRDVTELSRVLTGWTARWNDDGEYGFHFRAEVHDNDDKRLLGTLLRRGGQEQGVKVIQGLARDRRTARFLASKLCAYLVNDQPPDDLVEEIAAVYLRTGGHLPSVYEAIIFSDDFASRANYRTKFRTPFEFVAAALRATDSEISGYGPTLNALHAMGQPIYQQEDPTGYDDRAEDWLDPGVLVYRWRYALQLGRDSVKGVSLPSGFMQRFANQPPKQLKNALVQTLIPAGVDERTDRVLLEEIQRNQRFGHALGLVLGSPAFQQQ